MGAAKAIQSTVQVKDIMVQPVCVVTPQMKLWEVAELFVSRHISGAPVVDQAGRVMSVIGEGLTLRLAATSGLEATVSDCLTQMPGPSKLVTVSPHHSIADVYKLFVKHNIHRVPVVDDGGHLKGIVSRSMILKIFIEAHYGRPLPKKA
jgi:CBS domain-containing protein